MSDICAMSLREVASALKGKKIGVVETVQACLARIESTDDKIEALLAIDAKNALDLARKLDAAPPDESKPLWGVPITLKDAISTRGLTTTAASRILDNFVPIYDAFVANRLKEAGAIILAKTNMDEFAMGSATENSAFKKTRNPWNLNRVPGGSSGGSAASVVTGQAFASLGSDTGGSIRQPAGFCGCVGLKPTYGRVSRYGLFAFASSLDQIGPIARNVEDAALMLNIIGGHDPLDATSDPRPMEDYLSAACDLKPAQPLAGVRLGYPEDFFGTGLAPEVREQCADALKLATKLGADIIKVKLPDPDVASATYYIISMAEASSNLARYDGVRYGRRATGVSTLDELYRQSRTQGFGREVKRRIMLGSYVLSSGYYDAYFKKAAQTRRIILNSYQDALRQCDMLVMPVAPVTAWPLGSHEENPLQAYLMDAYTLPANLAGLPGISLPIGLGCDSKLPVGLQLIGQSFGEGAILRVANALERELPPLGAPPLTAF